jgi:hypothetical protein
MDELHFKCPAFLAQRFWLLCASRNETPGAVLREFMITEISRADAGFEFDLKEETGADPWSVRQGRRGTKPAPPTGGPD